MLLDGLKLMIIGMGTVFIFLGIMVLVISASAKILAPFAWLLEPKDEKPERTPVSNAGKVADAQIAAAVAAVQMHRSRNNTK